MRTTVITGGGSGIGRATARRQASAGDQVVILDRDQTAGEETVAAIRASGGEAICIECDVSDTNSTEKAFQKLDRIDALVNNAGVAHIGNVEQTSPDDLDRLYRVNVKGVYHCLHFAIPKMVTQGSGVIVNLASIASKIGIRDRFAYSMTKGAVLTMTLSVARDYIDRKIRCNCICPGAFTPRSWTVISRATTLPPSARRYSTSFRLTSRSDAWAVPRKSPRWRISCCRTRRISSPARRLRP